MLTDALLLAPALVARDLTVGDLLALAGFPVDEAVRVRGNLLRRWKRAGWIEDFGVRLSGRACTASEPLGDHGHAGMVLGALQAGFRGSVAALAALLGEVDPDGQATRALERAVEAGVEDGWLLPVRAVVLTGQGRAMVEADPEALVLAERERQARVKAREIARLTEREARELAALCPEDPALALARATRGAVVPRASTEDLGRSGLPGRTVPARFQHRGEAQ